jgi:hypothetical protein
MTEVLTWPTAFIMLPSHTHFSNVHLMHVPKAAVSCKIDIIPAKIFGAAQGTSNKFKDQDWQHKLINNTTQTENSPTM